MSGTKLALCDESILCNYCVIIAVIVITGIIIILVSAAEYVIACVSTRVNCVSKIVIGELFIKSVLPFVLPSS